MQAIGERLREARMRQELDLTEVEVATKIRAKYLRALENDEFSMLPGSTYVKSFLRTYAEYLGLDAQLLVEEFRAQHEPRGEGEVQTLAPPSARTRAALERRGALGGPPFGPGSLAVGLILLILAVLAIIGFASDDGGGGKKKPAKSGTAAKKKHGAAAKQHRKAAPATPVRSTVRLKVVPTETTYLCLDDGHGTKLFEGTISTAQSFRGKRLRINLGRSSASLYANGKRVSVPRTSEAVGLSFSRTGRVTPLPPGQRPCA